MSKIDFPEYSGVRCLMMPFVQGEPASIPEQYAPYHDVIASNYLNKGDVGYLTIDESPVLKGLPHRGNRAKFGRALHTEAGLRPFSGQYVWGGGGWGHSPAVTLDRDTKILLVNNLDNSCAVWDSVHTDTSIDGDIGDHSDEYPYSDAIMMKSGEVATIGILTPHESLPVDSDYNRQFVRIMDNGVHGREEYFTINPLMDKYV